MELTRSDCEILGFLRDNDFTDQYRSATLREIMQITKNSRPTTYRKMMNLCEYGFVRKGCKAVNADTFYLDHKGLGIIGGRDSNVQIQQIKNRNTVSYDNASIRNKLADIMDRGLMLKSIATNAGLSESELSRFKNGVDALKESDIKTLAEYLGAVVIPRWNIGEKGQKKQMTMRERLLASRNASIQKQQAEKVESTRDWLFM